MSTLLRRLLGEVSGARVRLAGSLLLSLLAGLCGIALMGSSGWLLSRAAELPPVLHLQVAIVIVRACGLGRGAFRYAERLVSHDLALRLQGVLRLHTYRALASTTLLGRRRGDLLVRIVSDVDAIQDLVVRVVLPFASAGILAAATSVAMTVLHPLAGLALLASAVVAGALVPWWAARASRAADREIAPARGELADGVRQIGRAATDLAAYGDTRLIDRALAVDDRLRRAEERAALVRGAASGVQVLAAGLAVVVALAAGAYAVQAGTLGRVWLAVLVLTPLALHDLLAPLVQAAQTQTRAGASLARVTAIMDEPPVGAGDLTAAEVAARPRLALTGVDCGWPGHRPVVTGLDLVVEPGDRVALVGRSGIGKTTIAATLMGLIPPGAGTVERTGTVGYLAQDAHVFNTSVAENVRIGARDATDAEVDDALARAGLALDPQRIVGEEGSRVSGGEARRVALARLLVGRRQSWILDEPTEHLDDETARRLMDDVFAAAADSPLLVITHDPRVMVRCDRVIDLAIHQQN
ncbi:thiol reductant ABC exporter subunit CydC [Mariniluteicoccus flavus]